MLNKLIEAALIVVLAVATVGQISRFMYTVRVAQLQIIKDSQSSKWGRLNLLPIRK